MAKVYIGNIEVTDMRRGNSELQKIFRGNSPVWARASGGGGGVFKSAKEILAANPSATSGVYSIQPDPNKPAFDAYCDMDNDGGGWTLVLSGGDTQFGHTSTFWDGTLDSNISYPFSGSTFNTSNSETLINSYDFTDMRVEYSDTQKSILVSSANSTFAQKKANTTSWTAQSGVNLTWGQSDGDGYSRGNFLLGHKGAAAGYGDYDYSFIGATSYGYSYYGHGFYYETFSDTCNRSQRCNNSSYQLGTSIGKQGHRYSRSTSSSNLWFR